MRNAIRYVPALVAALVLTASAPAQFGEAAGFGEMMSPYFLRRDLTIFVDELELDEGQTAILESLYSDYEDEHEAGKVRMLERLSNMRDELENLERDRIMQLVFKPFEDRSEEWEGMRTQFLANVEAILNGRQLEMYTQFRRQLRREKEIPKGRFSGESVNLFHAVAQLDLAPSVLEYLQPTLDQYDLRLDAALEVRERLLRDSRLAMMTSIKDDDHASALTIYDRQIDARIAVRRINDEFTMVLYEALPAEADAEFLATVRERAYPRIYRATAVQRILAAAKQLEGLSSETLQAIENLEASYLAEVAGINDTIRRLLQEYEPEEARFRASSFAARSEGKRPSKPSDPTRDEYRRRDEVGRRYVEMLRDLLTPEQFESLPGAQRALRSTKGEDSDESLLERKKRRMQSPDGNPTSLTPSGGRPMKKKG